MEKRIQMETSEVLYAAADLIERDGWHQGGYAPDQTEEGTPMAGLPVCAMGAIYEAAAASVKWSESLGCWIGFGGFTVPVRVGGVLREYLGNPGVDVPTWNDRKGRTAAEVVEALRACAVIEAAKETADEREAVSA